MGILGGKVNLAHLELVGKFVPFRTLKELGELRKASSEEGKLRHNVVDVRKDTAKRNLKGFIKHENEGIVHAENAFNALFALLGNCAYDIDNIKMGIKEFHKRNIDIEKKGASVEAVDPSDKQLRMALGRINEKLKRIGSTLSVLGDK